MSRFGSESQWDYDPTLLIINTVSTRERQLASNAYMEVENQVYIPTEELEKDEWEKVELEYSTNGQADTYQQELNTSVDNEKDFYNYYNDQIWLLVSYDLANVYLFVCADVLLHWNCFFTM